MQRSTRVLLIKEIESEFESHIQERTSKSATEAGPSFPGKEELLAAAAATLQP